MLQDRGFEAGQIDPTLFTKKVKGELFVCQLYVDDIIFGSPNKAFNEEFAALMTSKFEMSSMGELKFFLGFEVKQRREGTFINQSKYTQDMLKRFKLSDVKPASTPMPTKCQLDIDPNGKAVDQKVYRSMIGSLLYLCASRPDIMLCGNMCTVSSRTKGKPLCGGQANLSIFGSYPKLWLMVPKRGKLQA